MDLFEAIKWVIISVAAGFAVFAARQLLSRRPLSGWLKAFLLVAVCGGLAVVDMYLIEPNWIAVEKVVIHNRRLSDIVGDTKVVQISDLHVPDRPGFREESLIRRVNRLRPDLIVITGDFVSDKNGKRPAIDVTRRMVATLGKFGVPGNNDSHRFKPGEMRKSFPAAGVDILVNENRRIRLRNGKVLNLAGVNDPVTGQARIDLAMAGVPAGEPVIMLAHSPSLLSVAADKGVDLLLAGHTHGGQVGWNYLVRSFKGADPVLTMRGLYREKQTLLYVNRGIGTTTKPLRFFCRPEITVFEFKQ